MEAVVVLDGVEGFKDISPGPGGVASEVCPEVVVFWFAAVVDYAIYGGGSTKCFPSWPCTKLFKNGTKLLYHAKMNE